MGRRPRRLPRPQDEGTSQDLDRGLDELNGPDTSPAYVVRLGSIDPREIKGVEAGTREAERCIRYVTKYLTKDLGDHTKARGDPQQAHADRLHAELSVLPCSQSCANWLLYGVQPDGAKAGLVPGRCKGKVHQRSTLGFTGRRVLISRQWSGKTLADHRADNQAWVKAITAGAVDGEDKADAQPDPADGSKRYHFALARPGDPDVPPVEHRILRAISTRIRWRQALVVARERGPGAVSATQDPPPAAQAA